MIKIQDPHLEGNRSDTVKQERRNEIENLSKGNANFLSLLSC